MNLINDEHTGEAGLVTRLEAFVDMLARRRRVARRERPLQRNATCRRLVWGGDQAASECERACGG